MRAMVSAGIAASRLELLAAQPSVTRLRRRADALGMVDIANRLDERVAAARAIAIRLRAAAEDGPADPAPTTRRLPVGSGDGEAIVMAGRGALRYRIWIEGGLITALAVDTPTERLIAPGGALLCALQGRRLRAPADKVAGLVLAAFDPCIPCTIEVHEQQVVVAAASAAERISAQA
jgi:Ni,Fe-hydrogenase I large subunit